VLSTSTSTTPPAFAGYTTHQSSAVLLASDPDAEDVSWIAFPIFVPAEAADDLGAANEGDADAMVVAPMNNKNAPP
jgi:hypothetical protein